MPIAMTEKFWSAPPDKKPMNWRNCPELMRLCHWVMLTNGTWTYTASTNAANAPNTKRMRFRSSGTTIAFARLRQIVIGLLLFLEFRAGRFELRFRGARESDA